MSNNIFGSSVDKFSARTQLKDCSYDQFILVASSGYATTGEYIFNGVAEIDISMDMIGKVTTVVEREIVDALQ